MNKFFLFLTLSYFTIQITFAQEIIQLPITKQDNSIAWPSEEKEYHSDIWDTEVLTNVAQPSMEVYLPVAGTVNGTAVVICPGGGLYAHSINSEGRQVAQWLAQRGVTAFVLKYRLVPTGEDATKQINEDGAQVYVKARKILPFAVSDGLNAIEYIRKNAESYQIDPQRIGVMGFSAGGAVTMGVTFSYTAANRPNFIAPIYAWMVIMDEYEVPSDAPPMFALCASDDALEGLALSNVDLYTAWRKAGKDAELHMYARGGHGFGMRIKNLPSDSWIIRFGEWLDMQGWMKKQ
ncbi:MAG: alpha/beta hydrolase [Bacteroidota bacterium]